MEYIEGRSLAEIISEADHIHNKAIFDAVNEAMNMVRPYGKQGEPMPWSTQGRKNAYSSIENNIESVYKSLEKILHQVKYNVLSWASIRAGTISNSYSYQPEAPTSDDPKASSQENQIRRIL